MHSKQSPERRRARRYGLRLSAVVRERGRGRIPIRVIDISTNGCRIELSCGLLVGTSVWLSIAGLETLDTRIVWCHEGFAGLEFTVPITEAVLDNLLQQQESPSEEDIKTMRDIARRVRALSRLHHQRAFGRAGAGQVGDQPEVAWLAIAAALAVSPAKAGVHCNTGSGTYPHGCQPALA